MNPYDHNRYKAINEKILANLILSETEVSELETLAIKLAQTMLNEHQTGIYKVREKRVYFVNYAGFDIYFPTEKDAQKFVNKLNVKKI